METSRPAEIVRITRDELRLNLRDFAALIGEGLPGGCSRATIHTWERGAVDVPFEKMYYLYHHTDNPRIRVMADEVMAATYPNLWPERITCKDNGK